MSTFDLAEVDALARTSNVKQAAVWLGRLTREQICAMAPPATASPQVIRSPRSLPCFFREPEITRLAVRKPGRPRTSDTVNRA